VTVTAKSSAVPAGTVLAFDFGTQRIGVAVGETHTRLAHPLVTIAAPRHEETMRAIAALIEEWRPGLLVVGLPVHADGVPHAVTERARRFARHLERRFALPVEFCDERFTTQAANEALRESGARKRERKLARDSVAAQIFLQDYLDRHRTP
jgi:putative Holliday junction resolvase